MAASLTTNELQLDVLRLEVETAADFLIDQEQRLVRANGTINDLIAKLRMIEEQISQRTKN
jgi:hypothetical protein